MAKVSRFEIEPCNDSRNVKTEIDDVFDEIVERRVEIENESDNVFDEGFERKVHVASPELNLKNNLTLPVKLLCQEEEDDVFDEEREKAENALTRLGNTGIKVELIEDKVNDLKENLDSLTNIIKEEKIMMSNTEDIQSFIEFVKQEIKVEEDIEAERINEYNCPKCTFKTTQRAILENHSLSHTVENSRKDDTGMASQFEVDQNNINVKNIFEMIGHSSIGGGKKEADLKISKEKIVREKQIETNKIKLREQNANKNSEIKLLESETENKRYENGEVLNEDINTVTTVIDKEKEETPFNKNEQDILNGVSNVDSIFENMKNAIMENQCNQILKTDEVSLRLAETNKRKSVEEPSSPSKKIKLESDKIYRCGECSYQSHKRKCFNNHKIIHSKDVIKCDYCSFTTKLKRYMNSHMLVHLQPEEIKMYKCPHCSYQTKRRGVLPVHMVIHKKPEEVQMFHCYTCSYKTKRKANLKTHQLSHKSADDVTLYSCTICSFTAKRRSTVKAHMIVHQKMEDIHWYKCDKCSYSSKSKSGLKKHDLVHKNLDEIKTYDCPTCHYKAKHKNQLKSHLLMHKDPTEVEMHHCSHCPYKTKTKCNLVTHMVQHKKIEEIDMKKCEHCPYQTKLKCNLIKHLNRIHRRPVV